MPFLYANVVPDVNKVEGSNNSNIQVRGNTRHTSVTHKPYLLSRELVFDIQ